MAGHQAAMPGAWQTSGPLAAVTQPLVSIVYHEDGTCTVPPLYCDAYKHEKPQQQDLRELRYAGGLLLVQQAGRAALVQ